MSTYDKLLPLPQRNTRDRPLSQTDWFPAHKFSYHSILCSVKADAPLRHISIYAPQLSALTENMLTPLSVYLPVSAPTSSPPSFRFRDTPSISMRYHFSHSGVHPGLEPRSILPHCRIHPHS